MADGLRLNRNQLAAICGNDQRAIVTLEKVLARVDTTPTTIEEAVAQANQAIAMAAQALALASELMAQLDALGAAATPSVAIDLDHTAPAVQLGTMSSQDADAVEILGGTVDNTKIGETTAQTGRFTTIESTAPDGTSPLIVASQTLVENLYVARAQEADHALNADHASSADVASSLSSPSSLPGPATDLPTVISLANALRTAALDKGL